MSTGYSDWVLWETTDSYWLWCRQYNYDTTWVCTKPDSKPFHRLIGTTKDRAIKDFAA